MADPIVPAASDSESDRSMDPDEARDYADQFQIPGSPGSPGGVNDENLEILAAVLKCILECIDKADFACFTYLLPYMEPVHVEMRTVQGDSSELLCNISYYDIIYPIIIS